MELQLLIAPFFVTRDELKFNGSKLEGLDLGRRRNGKCTVKECTWKEVAVITKDIL